MSDKLKPCPFCGGRPDLSFEHSSEHPDWWKVTCVECGNRTASNTTSKATAIYNWNTRAALDQPQNDAEAVTVHRTTQGSVPSDGFDCVYLYENGEEVGSLNGPQNDPDVISRANHWTRSVTAPPSPELERMRKAMEIVRNMIDGKMIANAVTDIRTMKPLKDLVNESLRAGDNHASDGRESEINEAPLCKKCGHHATSERVLACGSSCQMRPSDTTPAQERREEIARAADSITAEVMRRRDIIIFESDRVKRGPMMIEAADYVRDAILALPPAPKGEPSQEWNEAVEAAAFYLEAIHDDDPCIMEFCKDHAEQIRALRREPEGER